MNRTQKEAVFCLASGLLTFPMFAYGFYKLFILKETFTGLERFLVLTVVILVLGIQLALLVWTFKRQSPREVEDDERDKLIKARAAMAAFIAACFILPVVSVIPRLIVGDNGCVPAWSLPFIIFGALLIPGTIYWIAILVQYGWKGKENE
jgi:formate hydrogenlyase subunit 3/multisubunit Na+/H+ antiporter MnhD subunit